MKFLTSILCLASCIVLPAYAESMSSKTHKKYYIKPYLGISNLGDSRADIEQTQSLNGAYSLKNDTGFVSGLALGYELNPSWALELAWEFRSNDTNFNNRQSASDLKGDNIASNTFWLNGYYQFKPLDQFTPYVGAGVAWVEELDIDYIQNGEESSFSDSGTALQLIAGVKYKLASHWSADLQVRYMNAQLDELDAESGAGKIENIDYDPTSLVLGVRYNF